MPQNPLAPIIVTALLAQADFAWFDALRRQHYPAARNQVPVHLTLFHHLPPSALERLRRMLSAEVRTTVAPVARIVRPISLGQGVAFAVESPGLAGIRSRLADAMDGQLLPQDLAAWRPHITIQNKVAPAEARALLRELAAAWRPRPIGISGLAAYWYRGGPWQPIAEWRFSRSGPSRRS